MAQRLKTWVADESWLDGKIGDWIAANPITNVDWSGLDWNTAPKPPNLELNDLTDVSGTPTAGQVLTYDGSGWAPANGGGGGGGGGTTTFPLTNGKFLDGGPFDGSSAVTWDVLSTRDADPSSLVERDAGGSFAVINLGSSNIYNAGEIESGKYRIDKLSDKTTIYGTDYVLINNADRSFRCTWEDVKKYVTAGIGGGSLWYEVGGKNLRPTAPNEGLNLTGGAIRQRCNLRQLNCQHQGNF